MAGKIKSEWKPGVAPVAVIMISLNEGHNMEAVLKNLQGWAQEVFLVDSYSADDTVDIALRHGVHVVQRKFRGFGDQWNFALNNLPINAPWTMKVDPDERLTEKLKTELSQLVICTKAVGLAFNRRLWFMGKPLPIRQRIIRVWRTGRCRFSDVTVNEHPLLDGHVEFVQGDLEHYDSPDLHHWVEKQNRYTTAEALARVRRSPFSVPPRIFGNSLERRMWLKKNFHRIPFRYQLLYIQKIVAVKPWVSGRAGLAWARLRVFAGRMIEDKIQEMKNTGHEPNLPSVKCGAPHPRATQVD